MNRPRRPTTGIKPTCQECGSEKWPWGPREWVCPDCTKIIPTDRGDELDRPIDFRPTIIPMKQTARKAA
jgi:tRNA(Ile2) C34 agmatinyltransferase TiaS